MRLFFLIWASTEYYANNASEIATLEGGAAVSANGLNAATQDLVDLVLYGVLKTNRVTEGSLP